MPTVLTSFLRIQAVSAILILISTSLVQAQGSLQTLWDHNGSIVYLVANGTERAFYYQDPRPGIAEQGVRMDTLLFKGTARGSTYEGTAFIFRRGCGSFPYRVSGSIYDNYRRVVMEGRAPRIGTNCSVTGYINDRLEFTLIKPSQSSDAGPSIFQAFWTNSPDCRGSIGVTIMDGEISYWHRFVARGHRDNERHGSCDIRYVGALNVQEITVDYLNCDHPGHVQNNVVFRLLSPTSLETPQGRMYRCE